MIGFAASKEDSGVLRQVRMMANAVDMVGMKADNERKDSKLLARNG